MKRLLLTLMVSLLAVPFIYAQDEEEEEIVISSPVQESEIQSEMPPLTVHVGAGLGLASGEYITGGPMGVGVMVGLPYSMPLGPLDLSFNVLLAMNKADYNYEEGASVTQIIATVGTFIPNTPVSVWGGGGLAGEGLGLSGGVGIPVNAFVPDLPVIVQVGAGINILTAIDDHIDGNTGFINGYVTVGKAF